MKKVGYLKSVLSASALSLSVFASALLPTERAFALEDFLEELEAAAAPVVAKTLTCESVNDTSFKIGVDLGAVGEIIQIYSEEGRIYEVDSNADISAVYFNVKDEIASYPLALDVAKHALAAGQTYDAVQASVVTHAKGLSAWARMGATFASQMSSASDSGTGILLLQYLEADKPVGAAIFAGWGGVFKNCH
ncbi:MAG: hypothetical protein RBT63_10210 [Bdellovibrionales bacterium]|jgi:hypothetical protein|nr:hypothetical protein [Bdellovibrionales bacterium]